MRQRIRTHVGIILLFSVLPLAAFPQDTNKAPAPKTRIAMLGTGTPNPDPSRSGPATAVVVNGTAYLVDFGPGVVRQVAAAHAKGVSALAVVNLKFAFLTHLHSDHTVGYPDLIFTPWAIGRKESLHVYGPKGLRSMTKHILRAYQEDVEIRMKDKKRLGQPGYAEGIKVHAHEIKPGIVYKDSNVTVNAFLVNHGDVPNAYGYRFDTGDRSVVISGDTAPSENLIEHSRGCDVLIHEAYSMASYDKVSPRFQEYRRKHHTSSHQLAEIAKQIRPRLLVLYHRANPGGVGLPDPEEALLREVRERYDGEVVTGHDLDIF